MSVSKALTPVKIISAASLGANVVGTPTNIQYLDNISIQLNITGASAAGTITIQGSLDYAQTPFNAANAGSWDSLGVTYTVAGAATKIISLTQVCVPWIRIVFTRDSGTGSIDAYISGKAI